MLALKRFLTAIAFTAALWVFFMTIFGAMLGGVAGYQAGLRTSSSPEPPQDFQSGFQKGYQNGLDEGIEMRRKWGKTMRWTALGAAAVVSTGLVFSGIFPWCRRLRLPPPLPGPLSVGP